MANSQDTNERLAQPEHDWQDLYEKEKRRAEMWRDKYESVAGPDQRVYPAQPEQEPFVVKHYVSDERPMIKGNGFDGLEIGEDREEAQAFVDWINARLSRREWVGLTDEEIHEVVSKKWWDWEDAFDIEGFSRAIEAKLKEMNA